MHYSNLTGITLLLSFLLACTPDEGQKPITPPLGAISVMNLESRADYDLPFALKNDTNLFTLVALNRQMQKFEYNRYIDFPMTGFYELIIYYTDEEKANDTLVFTTKTAEREASEWGIPTWVPKPFVTSRLVNETIRSIYPRHYVDGINIPFVFNTVISDTITPVYCEGIFQAKSDTFQIKRGVGSIHISSAELNSEAVFTLGGKHVLTNLTKLSNSPQILQGTITSAIEIPANSVVKITGNVTLSATASMVVHEGAIIIIDEAVDINLSGPVKFSGTANNPVLVTCSNPDKFWGGFITREPGGTIEAQYTMFCQSGYHTGGSYNWGHAGRQALFYTQNSELTLDHCYITDHIGQVFYPLDAKLSLSHILVQRVKTGGQINTSVLNITNSVFTDFPNDDYIFADNDNDALYISASDATITNSVFMFAKDDGVDSGNNDGGTVTFNNCRFEACFHEGAALSSKTPAVKLHSFINCVFTNCGQGLELGFSSPFHQVIADGCQFVENGVGVRYGDNYDWSYIDGTMLIKNSNSIHNQIDIWNMVRMNWAPKINNLTFENTKISKYSYQYPDIEIINP